MEVPRTIERIRGGKVTDIEIPTPPRSGINQATHWPTPDSVERPSKRTRPTVKVQPVVHQTHAIPPTPETLPRPPRKSLEHATAEIRPPSPSGHTTFFQATSHSGSLDEKINTRRPGLTFAQQMGLLLNASSTHASRPGAGVGMGRGRQGVPKKDQIMAGRLAEPVALSGPVPMDDNPFLSKPTHKALFSPGGATVHDSCLSAGDSHHMATPRLASRPEMSTTLVHPDGLVTPPSTRPLKRVRITAAHDDCEAEAKRLEAETTQRRKEEARKRKEEEERMRKQKEMRQMMDVESNPFLAKPGESSRQRHPLPADESRPTVTYVFRGARKVFANPFYPAERAYPPADLDPEDEDYELHPNPKPRLLFPSPPPLEKRFKPEDFETLASDSDSQETSPQSSPLMATPRRRLFTQEIALAGGGKDAQGAKRCHHAVEEEDDDDEVMLDSSPPVKRRLFQPEPVKKRKRAAEPRVQTREDKRLRR